MPKIILNSKVGERKRISKGRVKSAYLRRTTKGESIYVEHFDNEERNLRERKGLDTPVVSGINAVY